MDIRISYHIVVSLHEDNTLIYFGFSRSMMMFLEITMFVLLQKSLWFYLNPLHWVTRLCMWPLPCLVLALWTNIKNCYLIFLQPVLNVDLRLLLVLKIWFSTGIVRIIFVIILHGHLSTGMDVVWLACAQSANVKCIAWLFMF